eukprot:4413651-Pyramimonas_sp.AAC.1
MTLVPASTMPSGGEGADQYKPRGALLAKALEGSNELFDSESMERPILARLSAELDEEEEEEEQLTFDYDGDDAFPDEKEEEEDDDEYDDLNVQ